MTRDRNQHEQELRPFAPITRAAGHSRRRFLQGLGTAMALPLLESLPTAAAATGSSSAVPASLHPTRAAFIFFPNGAIMPHWTPEAEGKDFKLPKTLERLKEYQSKMLVLSGLAQKNAESLGDGGGDHARNVAAYLTGAHPFKTDGANIRNGVSIDQVLAQKLGKNTRLPSLELGIEEGRVAGKCDSGYSCAYATNMSWRDEKTPVPKETNPRLVFERLFGGDEERQQAEGRLRRLHTRQSILDFVMEDARRLQPTLAVKDRAKLDEYLTSVREIEQRLERAETAGIVTPPAGAVKPQGKPGAFIDHSKLMIDLMVLAFQTDSTRVATFMLGNAGSDRKYPEIDVREGHHYLSHHRLDEEKMAKIQKIDDLFVQQFEYLLKRLSEVQEGDGSLLDHSMVLYGSAISDANRHRHHNLPIIVAGSGNGALATGRHIKYKDYTPLCNLFLSMFDRLGVDGIEKFGDSTGRLADLG